ncbi:unnamed protein product [Trichogramma brassicae]|uniref:Retrotransposon gag domain-containing protein n=1 Tax=Trichogramma brassicae TaxID=86971 RepID=A0A6H5HWM7_9HYME|nr:unnamed protein product [Trichogramma brassicae]
MQKENDKTQAYAERVEKENSENREIIKRLEAQMTELVSSTRIGQSRSRHINFRDTFNTHYISSVAGSQPATDQQNRNGTTATNRNEPITPEALLNNTQPATTNAVSRTVSSQLDIGRIVRGWNLKYSGEPGDSIEEFLERVRECRRLTQLTDNDLLNAMSELLTGSARLWARQTQQEWTSWQHFCNEARACFGVDRRFQQALIKEAQRRTQGDLEPVRSYIFALLTIMSKFEDQWPVEMQLDLLHTNMRPDLQMQVRRSSVTTVGQLLELAREAEGIELARRVYQRPPPKEHSVMPELACPTEWREDTRAMSFNSKTAHTSPVQVSAIESCEKSPNLQSILEKLSEELKILSTRVAKIDAEQTARKSSRNNGSQERKPKSDKNKDKTPGPTQKYSCWKCSWPGYTKKNMPRVCGKRKRESVGEVATTPGPDNRTSLIASDEQKREAHHQAESPSTANDNQPLDAKIVIESIRDAPPELSAEQTGPMRNGHKCECRKTIS